LPIRAPGALQIDFKELDKYLKAKPEPNKIIKKKKIFDILSSLSPSLFNGILVPFALLYQINQISDF
jgi:hypothetical protein